MRRAGRSGIEAGQRTRHVGARCPECRCSLTRVILEESRARDSMPCGGQRHRSRRGIEAGMSAPDVLSADVALRTSLWRNFERVTWRDAGSSGIAADMSALDVRSADVVSRAPRGVRARYDRSTHNVDRTIRLHQPARHTDSLHKWAEHRGVCDRGIRRDMQARIETHDSRKSRHCKRRESMYTFALPSARPNTRLGTACLAAGCVPEFIRTL